MMKISVRESDKGAILDLDGPLKMGDPEQSFREQVEQLLNKGTRNLAVNLGKVPEVDSSGIGALVRAFSAAKAAGGKCVLFGVPKRIRQTLKMVRLDNVLAMVEDEKAALTRF